MITLELEEKNILIEFPESWDEMSEPQAHYCLKQAIKMLAGKISEDEFKTLCFYKIADIKRNWRTVMWERLVSAEQLQKKNANAWQLADKLTAFMFNAPEQENAKPEFAFEAVTNFLPTVKIGRQIFYGPQTLLMDLTFAEFRTAIEELNAYFESKDEHQLSMLFAVLYRPPREDLKEAKQDPEFDGRIKTAFNRSHQEAHAKKLDNLKPWQRMAILLHFTWCINYIKSQDLIIEGRKINFSPLFPKPKESNRSEKPSTGWTGVLFGIAEKGIFGNIKQTDQSNLFDILLLLYDNYLQVEEIKRNSKRP